MHTILMFTLHHHLTDTVYVCITAKSRDEHIMSNYSFQQVFLMYSQIMLASYLASYRKLDSLTLIYILLQF